MNKVSKNFLIQKFAEKHPERMMELNEAYSEMVKAFDASQDILNNNFVADVDASHNIQGSRETVENHSKVSYFSDFIFIQQMMTLELDIILGITDTSYRYGRDQSEKLPGDAQQHQQRKGIEDHEPFNIQK